MTKQQAIELLTVIKNWCFQRYDGRTSFIRENDYGIRIFELLPQYKETFPKNCFYTGSVYRKMEKGSNCPKKLVACSKEKGANERIGIFSLKRPRYYQSTCINGYDLHNIVSYLMSNFGLTEPKCVCTGLLRRTEEEAEVICYMEQRNFKKQDTIRR